MIGVRRALLSVSDKRGIVDLARGLAALGAEVVSTGGTSCAIAAAGVPVTEIAAVTGFPEMLGGRVKTLHPAVHAGILFRRGVPDDEGAMAAAGLGAVDLVAVNLYPFEAAVSREAARAEIIEEIDIGGPALLRSSAKNHEHVVVLCDPDDYGPVLEEMRASGGVTPERAAALAAKAFRRTAAYDAAIAAWMSREEDPGTLPGTLHVALRRALPLRYGENPHQEAGYYAVEGYSEPWRRIAGKDLSYNNLLDLDAGRALLAEFDGPAAVAIKHNSPCGAALGENVSSAVSRALAGDPLSAFGGVVLVNRPVDARAAEHLAGIFLEVVAAPAFDDDALEVLARKKNLVRLILEPHVAPPLVLRTALGGALVQTPDPPGGLPPDARCVTRTAPTDAQWRDLDFAWRLCRHVRSNAIVLARGGMLIGAGAGQQSRIDSVEVALMKASRCGHPVEGAVLASDAFFPFRDSVDRAVGAGVAAFVEPGGSVRDEESIAAADESGRAMVFTGRRAFRH
jgi:phosphoribosylaminoimidazolecarboxamide formyltransferase/IMP cyclohydrolase